MKRKYEREIPQGFLSELMQPVISAARRRGCFVDLAGPNTELTVLNISKKNEENREELVLSFILNYSGAIVNVIPKSTGMFPDMSNKGPQLRSFELADPNLMGKMIEYMETFI